MEAPCARHDDKIYNHGLIFLLELEMVGVLVGSWTIMMNTSNNSDDAITPPISVSPIAQHA